MSKSLQDIQTSVIKNLEGLKENHDRYYYINISVYDKQEVIIGRKIDLDAKLFYLRSAYDESTNAMKGNENIRLISCGSFDKLEVKGLDI